jgi:hypothetical protein
MKKKRHQHYFEVFPFFFIRLSDTINQVQMHCSVGSYISLIARKKMKASFIVIPSSAAVMEGCWLELVVT